MDNNIAYAVIITIFYFIRAGFLSLNNKPTGFLWVSAFFVFIPFEFSKSLTTYNANQVFGTLGTTIKITMPIVMSLYIFFFKKWKRKAIKSENKKSYFVSIVFGLILISFINPYNVSKLGTFIFFLFFTSNIILFYLFSNFIKKEQIIIGIYDGFAILCLLQSLLAICFPLLNLPVVTTLFHTAGEIGATREGTRVGAIGFFLHPGNLALFTVIASCFFLSCYLGNYKRKKSMMLLIINSLTIVLTYSRTSYISFVIVMFLVAYIYVNAHKNILSPFNIIKFVLPIGLCLYWLIYLSPFSSTFLKSDSDAQYENRMVHYLMAFDIFEKSPYIGVGLNAHLAYIATQTAITQLDVTNSQFFVNNPIHSIHLIVLAETGVIGFVLWWLFIFTNFYRAKKQLSFKRNEIMSSTFIGVIITVCIYGISGWAPFSYSIFPLFLFFIYFFNRFESHLTEKK